MKAIAPAKVILSGEHAIVHGHPALAIAVNRYVTATLTAEHRPQIAFDLANLAHRSRFSLSRLRKLKDKIKRKYHRFLAGDFTIREVLQKPFELAQFALSLVTESVHHDMTQGMKVHLQSNIPVGCGMGSSAATIVSVLSAMASFLRIPLSSEALLQLALEAENMQHGHSSGLDLHVSLQGGCLYARDKLFLSRELPPMTLSLVNTGAPASTTGECVTQVAPYFMTSKIGDDFATVTNAMDQALQEQNWQTVRDAVKENHRLLTVIGAVPEKVQHFIAEVEQYGGAAKICGAGAVHGEQAGMVWVNLEDTTALSTLATRYGYSLLALQGEPRGVYAA